MVSEITKCKVALGYYDSNSAIPNVLLGWYQDIQVICQSFETIMHAYSDN